MNRRKNTLNHLITAFFVLLLLLGSSVTLKADAALSPDYHLKEVVVLSRHNIRSPLSAKGSILDSATPYSWYEWSSNASELSLRGGLLETAMGQYFRKWLESEGLIPENFRPEGNEIRFYANAKQRTIATARYFASGFLPVADVQIETHQEYDQMDPVFTPQLIFVSDKYIEDAKKQMSELLPDLQEEYALLSEVLDLKESQGYKNGEISDLNNDDIEFVLKLNSEPDTTGSLKSAASLSDALILQYYEESDEKQAAFGHDLSFAEWQMISSIKDTYIDVLYTAPLVCINVAHPLLQEIDRELENDERLFSFLCGHDSNISSVLAALEVKDYVLDDSIENTVPIGSKLVFEKWEKAGTEFIRVNLVYDSADKLRNISIHDLNDPPLSCTLQFNGLSANEDGMYLLDDFSRHLQAKIDVFAEMVRKYDPQPSSMPMTGVE